MQGGPWNSGASTNLAKEQHCTLQSRGKEVEGGGCRGGDRAVEREGGGKGAACGGRTRRSGRKGEQEQMRLWSPPWVTLNVQNRMPEHTGATTSKNGDIEEVTMGMVVQAAKAQTALSVEWRILG